MENDSNNLMLDKDDIEEKKLNKMSEEVIIFLNNFILIKKNYLLINIFAYFKGIFRALKSN